MLYGRLVAPKSCIAVSIPFAAPRFQPVSSLPGSKFLTSNFDDA